MRTFSLRNATTEELETYFELSQYFFGKESANRQQIQEFFQVTPESFFLLVHHPSHNLEKIVGIVSFVPITEVVAGDLEDEKINGTQFSANHVLAHKNSCGIYYLGAVGAIGFWPKGYITKFVTDKINELKTKSAKRIYARPINNDGLQLLKRLSFTCVNPIYNNEIDHIYCLRLRYCNVSPESG